LRMDIAGVDNTHVLVTILTDGEENDSKEFSGTQVKKIIDEQKAHGWTFTYIGANHDVEKTASKISITNTLNFESNEASVKALFVKESEARVRYSNHVSLKMNVSENFYGEIEEDKKEEANQDDK